MSETRMVCRKCGESWVVNCPDCVESRLEAAPEISKNPSEAAIKAALAAQCVEPDMTEALRMFKSLRAAYAIDYPIREGERDE